MEDGLGSTHPAVAQIYDQLALFYFFDGACAEAEQMALKSKAAVDSAFEGGEDDPAVAMCQLRLGSVLLSELGLAAGVLLGWSSVTAAAAVREVIPQRCTPRQSCSGVCLSSAKDGRRCNGYASLSHLT